MQPISIKQIQVEGDLRARALKSFARHHDAPYLPGAVGKTPYMSQGWPGDWEGRTVLALCLLSELLRAEPAYLDEVVFYIHDECNDKDYRGEKIDLSSINEQQHAAHSWLLRGLVEYYQKTNKPEILAWINNIIDNLYLPVEDHLINYPQTSEDRHSFHQGEAAGGINGSFKEWKLSSDIGCLFISMDGLSKVYELTRRPEIMRLLEKMIAIFSKIDYVGTPLQTHASLTCMRGVMRIYFLTGKKDLLELVQTFFKQYKRYGMSEYFANFDWFKHPSWSEPCGVIDSYMLALQLWAATKDSAYLEDVQLIWYNGVLRGQRPNGGFGCDTCVEDGWIRTTNFYEAYWCCTMRGGEGLGVPVRNGIYEEGNCFTFPVYLDAAFECSNGAVLRESTKMPTEGVVRWTVIKGTNEKAILRVYQPQCSRNAKITVNEKEIDYTVENGFVTFEVLLSTDSVIEFTFDFALHMETTIGYLHDADDLFTLRYGVLVLGTPKGILKKLDLTQFKKIGNGIFEGYNQQFFPLHLAYLMNENELKETSYQLLFRQ